MFCTSILMADGQVEKLPYNCMQLFCMRLEVNVKVGVISPAEEYVTAPLVAPLM